MSTSDGVMYSEGKVDSSDRDEQSIVGKKRTSSQSLQHENVLVDRTPVVIKKRRGRPPKLKLEERQRMTKEDDRGEPTSTTLIDEPAFSELDKVNDVHAFDKVKPLTKGNTLEGSGVKDWEGQGRGRGKRKPGFRRERTPTRVPPSRNAKYSVPGTPKPHDYIPPTTKSRPVFSPKRRNFKKVELDDERDSLKRSPNFRGFESDSEDSSYETDCILDGKISENSWVADSAPASPNICDPLESGISSKDYVRNSLYSLSMTRKKSDGSKDNVSIVTADTTKMDLVVRLTDCVQSRLRYSSGPSRLPRTNIYSLHQLDGTKSTGKRQGGGYPCRGIEPDRDKAKGGNWVGGGDDGCPGITCSTAKVCERETESASAPSQAHPKSLSTKEPVQGNSVTDAFPSFLSSSASSSGTAAAPADAGHSRSTSLHCPPYSVDTVPCTSTSSTPTSFQSHSGDYLDSPTSSITNCTSIMENADTTLPKKNMTSQVVALPTSATVALNKYQEQMNVMYQCVSSSQSQSCSLPEPDKSNPHWFSEFRKYDMWKMQLLQAEHQRLMDIESRRLDIYAGILKSLNDL